MLPRRTATFRRHQPLRDSSMHYLGLQVDGSKALKHRLSKLAACTYRALPSPQYPLIRSNDAVLSPQPPPTKAKNRSLTNRTGAPPGLPASPAVAAPAPCPPAARAPGGTP